MKWKFITKNYSDSVKIIADGMIAASPIIDSLRCVYITNDDDTVHIMTAFDMSDLDLPEEAIKSFQLYQAIDESIA